MAATAALAVLACAPAEADMLHATYRVSLVGLPIGSANLDAKLSPSSYAIRADAKLTGLAKMFSNARGASTGSGSIVGGRVSPETFATTAASSQMTRTIRMALAGNAVTGVDIAPPFDEKPDRVPLGPHDEQNVVDPVGAVVIPGAARARWRRPPPAIARSRSSTATPASTSISPTSASAAPRPRATTVRSPSAPPATCRSPATARTAPATKFMAENKDIEVWLAPVEADRV